MTAERSTTTAGIEITGTLAHTAWSRRELPPVETLPGGVMAVPLPMTGHPLRYVVCYVLESRPGPVLIDVGWPGDVTFDALTAGLATIGLTVADVHGVLVSHAHSDHHGLAGRIREVSGCWIGMHQADIDLLRQMADGRAPRQRNGSFLDIVGTPDEERRPMKLQSGILERVAKAIPDRVVRDGAADLVPGRALVARWTPGHTPGHLVFVDTESDRVFTGDHLLPRITPHIGSYGIAGDPLGDYLASLRGMDYLGETTEVLPGHEYRFRGAHHRIAALAAHHEARLEELRRTVADVGPVSTWDVARQAHWSRGWSETTGSFRRLALAETLAHLRHLEELGIVRSSGAEPLLWTLS